MSLKGVHLVFILASIALAVFMAIWAAGVYVSGTGSAAHIATAVCSLAAAGGLAVYAARFVRKARRIGLD